jgi:hypothetical protein
MDHPTDCLCPEVCAPISLPTRSPSLNDALAAGPRSEVAQAVTLFEGLMPYGRRVAIDHLRALNGLQGKLR